MAMDRLDLYTNCVAIKDTYDVTKHAVISWHSAEHHEEAVMLPTLDRIVKFLDEEVPAGIDSIIVVAPGEGTLYNPQDDTTRSSLVVTFTAFSHSGDWLSWAHFPHGEVDDLMEAPEPPTGGVADAIVKRLVEL